VDSAAASEAVEFGMMHLSGHDRSQILLLPEVVDDYVGPDNPVRFIDAFVDGLDLAAASFSRVEPKVTGRPGYAPADHGNDKMARPLSTSGRLASWLESDVRRITAQYDKCL
jgi:hypothetical protein